MSKFQTWQTVHDQLNARRTALNEEISAYPGPITGCDAQFNHLLELRVGINADLARLAEMSDGADAKTLMRFIESCSFLSSGVEEK